MRGGFLFFLIFTFVGSQVFAGTRLDTCSGSLVLLPIKMQVRYPEVPAVGELYLPRQAPQQVSIYQKLSPGLVDENLEKARTLGLFDDFKILSDARPRESALRRPPTYDPEKLRKWFLESYDFSSELVPSPLEPIGLVTTRKMRDDPALEFAEKNLADLCRVTPSSSRGSLLTLPYPGFVSASGRFDEFYYWDAYFISRHLFVSGRLEQIGMLVENFLEQVRLHGFVPNANRDYYLSRSQPPFLSSLVRELVEASVASGVQSKERNKLLRWIENRAFPLVKADYEKFWMIKDTRFHAESALNHHWDLLNLPRPERHRNDNEQGLGKTYRDVRSAAESGLDFTVLLSDRASQVLGTLLNSMLYKTESDLAWLAGFLGRKAEASRFLVAARRRKRAMHRFLWNENSGRYENYSLATGRRIRGLSSETAFPLFVGLATRRQAIRIRNQLMRMRKPGGIMSSEFTDSFHQWDGNNGWAPYHYVVIEGLRRYGFFEDAREIARDWMRMVSEGYRKTGTMYERMDVETRMPPTVDDKKYPVQRDFLWTSAVYAWLKMSGY